MMCTFNFRSFLKMHHLAIDSKIIILLNDREDYRFILVLANKFFTDMNKVNIIFLFISLLQG